MSDNCEPGIAEVRAARMEISGRYGHDILRLLADHQQQLARYGDRPILPVPAPARPKKTGPRKPALV
jgi:hypothetical protein